MPSFLIFNNADNIININEILHKFALIVINCNLFIFLKEIWIKIEFESI
jgi:hypothetical protein